MSKFEYSYTYSEVCDVWQLVKDSFKGQISSISIDLWFSPITLESYNDDTHTLIMSIESKVKHDIISRSYMDHIRSKFCELLDGEIFIEFICTGEEVQAEQFFDVLGLKRENGRIVVDPEKAHTHVPTVPEPTRTETVDGVEIVPATFEMPKAEEITRKPGETTIEIAPNGAKIITQYDPIDAPNAISQIYGVEKGVEPFYVSENGSYAISLLRLWDFYENTAIYANIISMQSPLFLMTNPMIHSSSPPPRRRHRSSTVKALSQSFRHSTVSTPSTTL